MGSLTETVIYVIARSSALQNDEAILTHYNWEIASRSQFTPSTVEGLAMTAYVFLKIGIYQFFMRK